MVTFGLRALTTAFTGDTAPPHVVAVNPVSALANVPRNAKVRILFDEPIRATSLASVNLLLNGNPVAVTAVLSNANRTLTLTPTALLAPNAAYTISAAGVRDVAGNQVASTFTRSTSATGSGVDLINLSIVATNPQANETNVGRNVAPRVRFSDPIDPLSLTASTFYLANANGGGKIDGTMTLAPIASAPRFTSGAASRKHAGRHPGRRRSYADAAGNTGLGLAVSFMTGGATDTTAPTVRFIAPANGAAGVPSTQMSPSC